MEAASVQPAQPNTAVVRDKVCITGFSASTKDRVKTLYADPSFELWGMNSLYQFIPGPWHRWFEIHTFDHLKMIHKESFEKVDRTYRNFTIPIYMIEQVPEYPTSLRYPLEWVCETLGLSEPYFESTVAYAIAIVLAENVDFMRNYEGLGYGLRWKELHLYGIDMVHDTEWGYQRPNAEFFLGYAAAQGVKLVVPGPSALLSSEGRGAYGFDDDANGRLRDMLKAQESRRHQLESLIAKFTERADVELAQKHAHEGALQQLGETETLIRQLMRGLTLGGNQSLPDKVIDIEISKPEE